MSRFFLLPLCRRLGWDKWDISFPYNWTTPWFYGDMYQFVREHQLEGLKPDLWKPKMIHKLIRAKNLLESIPGLTAATAKTVWTNVASCRLTNGHKDLSWMAIQGGLPLRSFMHVHNLCTTRYCHGAPSRRKHFAHLSGVSFCTGNSKTLFPGGDYHTTRYFMDCSLASHCWGNPRGLMPYKLF